MNTHTFTTEQLTELLLDTIGRFTEHSNVYDFSNESPPWREALIYEVIAGLETPVMGVSESIPFDGSPQPYDTEDNLSLPELGL